MKWTPLGPRAALLDFENGAPGAESGRIRAVQRFLEDTAPPELEEFSIAFEKVLLEFVSAEAAENAAPWVRRLAELPPLPAAAARTHEIAVRYDGPDLVEVAARVGLGVGELVDLHTRPLYRVALLGFSPGFPYLDGLDSRLHLPRRASPRPRVPAGSVAIGAGHAGIYSVETPGGWHLLGRTDVRLFDPERRQPDEAAMFLLRPGDAVKFVAAD